MKYLLQTQTKAGMFYIGQTPDGRFHPIYNDESLGSYSQIWQATEDLAENATFSVYHQDTGKLLDTSLLKISPDPRDWDPYH